MKKIVKAFLHRLGVLGPFQSLYFNVRSLTPRVLRDEIGLLVGDSPDGYALPSSRLIFKIIACRWKSVYLSSGRRIADDLESILARTSRPLSSFESVLDFGCGCGRLARQLSGRTNASISGSDYNPDLVEWCQENLPFGTFSVNDLLPPVACEAESFDLIIARSVFTHLPEREQVAWIAEFNRILQPGGYVYLTMHGRALVSGLSKQQRQAFETGELVVTYAELAGENICSTYASTDFVRSSLLDGFSLVSHVEGRSVTHLRQDVYVLEKAAKTRDLD